MKNQNSLPQTLKGFRDFLPSEKRKRDYIKQKVTTIFERYGFEPIETPTLEYASLLLGKYGAEADKLMYTFEDKGERMVGLRYDQTVPTARVLAQYQNELPKYFRRYQIQNVFRADKPQKGRYREFTQCDCDIFGSTSPLADAEILAVYYAVFQEIGLDSLVIYVNDRQTLIQTLTPFTTKEVDIFSLIQSIDKLDKQTEEEVVEEIEQKGLSASEARSSLHAIQQAKPSNALLAIMQTAIDLGIPKQSLQFSPTLARGLNYYTGLIFEGKLEAYGIGSLGAGGRYDHLIEELSGVSVPAVGFGIGFDRTVEAAELMGLLPKEQAITQVLVTVFNEQLQTSSLQAAATLRAAGINIELYPGVDKLAKQLKLADQKHIPYVLVIGEEELKQNKVQLKDMQTGEQWSLNLEEVMEKLCGGDSCGCRGDKGECGDCQGECGDCEECGNCGCC